ncbi:MAG: cupredoxin family copper-binding protein [Gemmatimonadota bacterium]
MRRLLALETVAPLIAVGAIGFAAASGWSSSRPASKLVELTGIAFQPPSLTVSVGDTVVWLNRDLVPHTATATGKGGWDTGSIAVGDSARFVPKKAGQWQYMCTFHPTMKATLTVE